MSALQPTSETLDQAAETIRRGGVVVIPTETVYGVACSALDQEAIRRVYEIKGRPAENPLIIHIGSFSDLGRVAESWPPLAEKLAERFWPGPLTMVLPRGKDVPDEVTGGLDTVAVRVPDHPVALELIRRSGCPLAAPSANLFMGLSPTRAQDVDPAIQVDVDMILDGGPCRVGLESTVIDLTGEHPSILRPGGAPRAQIQAVVGSPLGQLPPKSIRSSPGMYPRHYAPKARVELVEEAPEKGAALVFEGGGTATRIKMPLEPKAYGALLYSALMKLDAQEPEVISVVRPPEAPEWEAVNDRLRKASSTES